MVKCCKISAVFDCWFSYLKQPSMVFDRPPIVAQCDRKRVLSSWSPYCGNVALKEFQVQFTSVRHLTPRQFVEKLAKELGVCGVVAGTLSCVIF